MASRNIFNRQVWKLQQRGFPLDYAKRIAYKNQLANWNIEEWSYRLTEEWKEYSNLFSEKRAVIRKNRAKDNRNNRGNWMLKWLI